MSDLGGHDNDVMFQMMDVRYPLTIEAVSPMGQAHPELAPATMTVIHIPTHGLLINGVVYSPTGPGPHPTIVICHGLPGNEKNATSK